MTEWQKWMLNFASTGVVAILAAWLSARWAIARTLREKWWARKEATYTEIIECILDRIRYFEELEKYYLHVNENPPDELVQCSNEARWKLKKASETGPFVVSGRAARVLNRLHKEGPQSDEYEPFREDFYGLQVQHYRECLEELRKCALADLKVR